MLYARNSLYLRGQRKVESKKMKKIIFKYYINTDHRSIGVPISIS